LEGVQVLERIRIAVSESNVPASNSEVVNFTISAGVIELAGDELEKEQLYQRASKLEQIAKEAGKNRLAY
jgi:PleD family two-component response regulator